jgi:CDP-6-deoxy-D-xylo-4-hexulose-3-dehydrase
MNQGNMMQVPVSGQVSGIEEIEMVDKVMESKHYAGGKFTEQFEHEFAKYIGKKYGVFCNSGSSANLLAVSSILEIKDYYTPALAFPTTINPLIQTNRNINLIDVEMDTLLPIGFSNYGSMTLGNYYPYSLIEDSCDAMWPGRYTGLMQTFSFYPAHHMSTGEGGMVTTDDPELYRELRSLRDWGRDCWCSPGNDNTCGKRFDQQFGKLPLGYDHKYVYSRIGYNLQATDIQAAIGLAQLKKLPEFTQTRIDNFNYLYEHLKKYESIFILPKSTLPNTPWFGFPLTLREDVGFNRVDIMRYLHNKGIGSRTIFGGNISKQPAYKDVKFRTDEPLTNCDKIMSDSFWVGCWHGLTFEQLDCTIYEIGEFLNRVDVLEGQQ